MDVQGAAGAAGEDEDVVRAGGDILILHDRDRKKLASICDASFGDVPCCATSLRVTLSLPPPPPPPAAALSLSLSFAPTLLASVVASVAVFASSLSPRRAAITTTSIERKKKKKRHP